ncbi:MAG: hypothetical protein RL272_586 [Candidatus Parcubacteria bacterium]|jgi:nicotinate (nicotinamide) nucleotide adenylyltransferase
MAKKTAVFGGSYNPSAVHHRDIAAAVAPHFDKVIVVPCGPRPDKPATGDIGPFHRAAMADLTFRGIPKVEVDLFDLEHATFTRTHALDERYAAREGGEIWHVVGADLVKGGKDGASSIQRTWEKGEELWRRCRFVVIAREGFPLDEADLPPDRMVITPPASGSSTSIRERAFRRESVACLVTPEVAAYMDRYNLYRGAVPMRTTRMAFPEPKALMVFDDRNPRAAALAARFEGYAADGAHADCILVIGGDGTMLHAIRKHWRRRLPFIGVNAGHKGYLLNDAAELVDPSFLFDRMHGQLLPLLYVECEAPGGATVGFYAFNDAWVQCVGQCAWLEVSVDGRVRIPKLVGDGALVSTAAGSTAYARAMGATPLLVDANAYLLVGNNVVEPRGWKSIPLSLESSAEFRSLDTSKRPLRAYVDGEDSGVVSRMRVRMSRIAAVELAFTPHRDMAAKLAEDLFPAT